MMPSPVVLGSSGTNNIAVSDGLLQNATDYHSIWDDVNRLRGHLDVPFFETCTSPCTGNPCGTGNLCAVYSPGNIDG